MESLCSRGTTIGVKTVRTKTCLGLPSLNVPRGPRAQQKGSCSRVGPQLQRCWTLRSKGPSTTTVAALPLPFLEISVSVLDTLDLVRSSVEEEIVFQATMQVPAHHAIACRIEAYDTPFAAAPALKAAPEEMTEEDRQYAACLASPAELEEAPSVALNRADGASFLQRSAPSVRFASGVLSLSFSVRQRSTDCTGEEEAEDDDYTQLMTGNTTHTHATEASAAGAARSMQPAGSEFLAGSGGSFALRLPSGSTGSSSHRLARNSSGHLSSQRPSQAGTLCASIPEDPVDLASAAAAAAAAAARQEAGATASAAASSTHTVPSARRSLEQQQQRSEAVQRPSGLLRIQSITAKGRQTEEIPFTAQLANKGVATLLGVGYMILHTLEARTQPQTNFLQYQIEGCAGPPSPAATTPWTLAPVKAHC